MAEVSDLSRSSGASKERRVGKLSIPLIRQVRTSHGLSAPVIKEFFHVHVQTLSKQFSAQQSRAAQIALAFRRQPGSFATLSVTSCSPAATSDGRCTDQTSLISLGQSMTTDQSSCVRADVDGSQNKGQAGRVRAAVLQVKSCSYLAQRHFSA